MLLTEGTELLIFDDPIAGWILELRHPKYGCVGWWFIWPEGKTGRLEQVLEALQRTLEKTAFLEAL